MIRVTRLNGTDLYVNEELVELIENTPDTVLTFVSGKKLLVTEGIADIVTKIKEFRKEVSGRL
ncbi:MAG: flagellar FlbD family protein [Candidatus Wallbacteria bacterium]|nr:flagellar FlbD family protein [Candidatus Wallbacteria bacterium]